ncbi:MAG: cytochrome c, partial [Candidatus Marinimicrobia bacterium]|nr:cytochrome c [Candidatus Neomarinimicrobiota bacterium]
TQPQRDRLLNLVFTAFINLDRQDKILPGVPPEPPAIPLSQELTDELYVANCQRCHGSFSTGKGPEYLNHLPRPRNLRNQIYFNTLADRRIARTIHDGIPGTAMPAFRDHLDGPAFWGPTEKVRAFSQR